MAGHKRVAQSLALLAYAPAKHSDLHIMKRCPHCAACAISLPVALRSDKRRPVRCSVCDEFSYLPPAATLLICATLDMLLLAALLVSEWVSGISIAYAACAITLVSLGSIAILWPLRPVPARGDKVSFTRPSPFYRGDS